jgi:uncharacterized protein (TIGR00251 family)
MDQPAWETTPAGIVLPVQAQPKARRNAVVGVRNGRLLVAVTAPPEHGKANDALRIVLAEALEIKRRQISLIAGATSSLKRFLIVEAELTALQDRIALLPD